MKFATKPIITLGMLLRYLEKLKIQIFCRYSANTEENANKLLEIIFRMAVPEVCDICRVSNG